MRVAKSDESPADSVSRRVSLGPGRPASSAVTRVRSSESVTPRPGPGTPGCRGATVTCFRAHGGTEPGRMAPAGGPT